MALDLLNSGNLEQLAMKGLMLFLFFFFSFPIESVYVCVVLCMSHGA